jgi:cardiolipin synthase
VRIRVRGIRGLRQEITMSTTKGRAFWIAAGAAVLTGVAIPAAYNFIGGEKRIERRLQRLYSIDDPGFSRELGVLLGPSVVEGNRFRVLRNGDEIFPAMLSAIRGARRTITFESYAYWSGEIGKDFAVALAERARAGVKVHVLLDWMGSAKIDNAMLRLMTDAGVELERYHPVHWYALGKLNNRTH